jgi:hypothetical protein
MRNRIIVASAVVSAFLLATKVGDTLAQTASAPTSKPIVLLRIVEQSTAKTISKPLAKHKFAARSRTRRYVRLTGRHHPVEVSASEEVRQGADVAVPPPPPLQTTPPPAAQQPGELLVGGDAFQVASSTEINEADLPANSSLLQSKGAPPNSVAEDDAPIREIADATKSDFANVTPKLERGADVGSAAWIQQVLAAFAGAVTAGAVAWFLIGRRPIAAATRSWRVWIQLLLVPPAFSTKRPLVSPRNVGSFI